MGVKIENEHDHENEHDGRGQTLANGQNPALPFLARR